MKKIKLEQKQLKYLYQESQWSQQKIADFLGVSRWAVFQNMKDSNIKARTKFETSRRYSIDQSFWGVWSSESAWLYGWFVGDGFFTRPYGFGFHLQEQDKPVLHKFKQILKSEHPIYDYGAPEIHFHSKRLIDDLRCLSYVNIPDVFLPDFIRGFFEAEGCVTWHKGIETEFVQKNKYILEFIRSSLFLDLVIKNGGGLNYVKSFGGWLLQFRIHDSISLYHYLYNNCGDLYLLRKKQKFEELIERQLA